MKKHILQALIEHLEFGLEYLEDTEGSPEEIQDMKEAIEELRSKYEEAS